MIDCAQNVTEKFRKSSVDLPHANVDLPQASVDLPQASDYWWQ
jgi:hypothetical protein